MRCLTKGLYSLELQMYMLMKKKLCLHPKSFLVFGLQIAARVAHRPQRTGICSWTEELYVLADFFHLYILVCRKVYLNCCGCHILHAYISSTSLTLTWFVCLLVCFLMGVFAKRGTHWTGALGSPAGCDPTLPICQMSGRRPQEALTSAGSTSKELQRPPWRLSCWGNTRKVK